MSLLFGIPYKKKAIFFRQLATLVQSAVSLDRAVATAGIGTLPESRAMAQRIVAGDSLSKSLARYPALFSEYEVQITRVGESSGTLDNQLVILADELERGYQLRQSLMSKLAYPILVAHMAVFIPPLVLLIQSGPAAYFRLTLGTLIPIYVIVALLTVLYRSGNSVGPMRTFIDSLLAWVPVLGNVLKLLALTRFLRTLSHLLEAGTLPYHAFQLGAQTCGNNHLRGLLLGGYKRLGQDRKISEWMQATGLFQPTSISLVASGEESGRMAAMLGKAAELVESEYREKLHLVMTVLPVFMLLGVGLIVGLRVYGMIKSYVQLLNL